MEGRDVLDLSQPMGGNATLPKSFIKFAREHRGFARNITFLRAVFPFRGIARENPDNLLKLLKLSTTLYDDINFIGFSTDRPAPFEKIAGTLRRLPASSEFEKRGLHFELKPHVENPKIGTLSIRGTAKRTYATAEVAIVAPHEIEIKVETWQDRAAQPEKRAEVRSATPEASQDLVEAPTTTYERLIAALESKQEQRETMTLDRQKAYLARMMRMTDVERIPAALERAVEKLGIPATASTAHVPGILVANYRGLNDNEHVANLMTELRSRPQVSLYVFNSASGMDWETLKARFENQLAGIRDRVEFVDRTSEAAGISEFVRNMARERGITDERSIIQVMTNEVLRSRREKEIIGRTWKEALGIAETNRTLVVVGAPKRIGGASVVTLLDILRASFEIQRALQASA